jgi:hypothetical protein
MSLAVNHLVGFGARRITSLSNPSMTYVTATSNTGTSLSTVTFAGVSLGAAASNRKIVVAWGGGGNYTLSSATIGGVSASAIVSDAQSTNLRVGIIIADVPTGTTGDVVLNFSSAAVSRPTIAVYRVVDLASSTAHATASDTTASSGVVSTTINVPANGFVIASSYDLDGASATWGAGMTEDSDQFVGSQSVHSAASDTVTTAESGKTVSCTSSNGSATRIAVVAASWGN